MCGFAGILDTDPQLTNHAMADLVGRMADALRARGPDDSGVWTDAEAGIALGFRRLSILDLSPAGHQPMISADGRFVIVFNGEAYNFAALRAELESHGVVFRGGSDTEVVLEACAYWGFLPTLRRLNGMYAIALWDRAKRTLSLARDRLGIKPLYLARMGASWLFASQPAAFRTRMHRPTSASPTVSPGKASMWGSAKPRRRTTKSGRPDSSQCRAICRGRSPPPAIRPRRPGMAVSPPGREGRWDGWPRRRG